MTGNLSESGMFVVTLATFEPGTGLRVLLDVDVPAIGLQGKVVWKRDAMILGRPAGIGVQLISPPGPYRELVTELP
jgi:Tfp pilus assembly protein PilZ